MSGTESSSVILYKPATMARKIYFKLNKYAVRTQGKFKGVSSSSTNSQLAKFQVQMQVSLQSGACPCQRLRGLFHRGCVEERRKLLKSSIKTSLQTQWSGEIKDAKHANGIIVAQLRCTNFIQECLMSNIWRKISAEAYRMECTLKVKRVNATKTPAKPH